MKLVQHDDPEDASTHRVQHDVEGVFMKNEEVRGDEDKDGRRRSGVERIDSIQDVAVFFLVVVVELVEMLDGDFAVSLGRAGEFFHNIRGERKQGDENEDDASFDGADGADEVGLPATGGMDGEHDVGSIGVEDRLTDVELHRTGRGSRPNVRGALTKCVAELRRFD